MTDANSVSGDCTDGLRQLFTLQSLQPSVNQSGDDGCHSLVENVMLSDTLLWKCNQAAAAACLCIYLTQLVIMSNVVVVELLYICISTSSAAVYFFHHLADICPSGLWSACSYSGPSPSCLLEENLCELVRLGFLQAGCLFCHPAVSVKPSKH